MLRDTQNRQVLYITGRSMYCYLYDNLEESFLFVPIHDSMNG